MITIIILSCLLLVLMYIAWNLLRKIDRIEDAYKDATTTNILLYETLEATYTKMKEIDDRGVFQSDDETGVIFKQLRDTLKIASIALQGDLNE